MSSEKIIEVSAAVIIRDGEILIASRPDHGSGEEFWEFPGGKREPGESFARCLTRELREELAVETEVYDQMFRTVYRYPDKTVDIRFIRCRILCREPDPKNGQRCRWIPAARIGEQNLLPADIPAAEFLRQAGY